MSTEEMKEVDDLDSTATLIAKGIELINFYVEELVKQYPHKREVIKELLSLIKNYLESSFALLQFYVKEEEVDKYVK